MNESLMKDFKKWNTAAQDKIIKLFPDEKEEKEHALAVLKLLNSGLDLNDPAKFQEELDELTDEEEKMRERVNKSQFMRAVEFLENVEQQYIKKIPDGVQLAFITTDPDGNIINQDESEHINPRYNDIANTKDNKVSQGAKDGEKKNIIASRYRYYVFDPAAPHITVREQAVIYYYYLHQDENPAANNKLTVSQIDDLLNVFMSLDDYYYNASENNTKDIDITEEFYKFLNGGKLSYRTRAKAQEAGAITNLPQMLAVPTQKEFLNSISFYNKGAAYLQQVKPSIPLKFENGFLSLDGISGNPFKAKLEDITTQENIEEIDLPILSIFYTIILHQFQASNYTELKDTVKISIPDLAEYMGLPRNLNKERTTELIEKVKSYHNIIGVIPSLRRTRSKTPPLPDLSPVLLLVNYFEDTNIIEFSSPYMNRIINTIFEESIRRNKQGEIERKNNGEPLLTASHSYLIKGSLAKARDQIAAENVKIIIQGIERAGKNNYKIAVKTLIDRNTQLKKRLESDPINKGRLLKQVFKNTWRLLQEETILTERYNNIILPDPNDPANIPTVKDIESKVFIITHDGKKK